MRTKYIKAQNRPFSEILAEETQEMQQDIRNWRTRGVGPGVQSPHGYQVHTLSVRKMHCAPRWAERTGNESFYHPSPFRGDEKGAFWRPRIASMGGARNGETLYGVTSEIAVFPELHADFEVPSYNFLYHKGNWQDEACERVFILEFDTPVQRCGHIYYFSYEFFECGMDKQVKQNVIKYHLDRALSTHLSEIERDAHMDLYRAISHLEAVQAYKHENPQDQDLSGYTEKTCVET